MVGLLAIKIENNDIVFDGSGRLSKVDGLTAIGQKIERRLTTMLTEYKFDIKMGLDWERVFDHFNEELIRLSVTECIRQVGEVTDIQNLTVSFDSANRKVNISANIITNYGITTVTTVL